VERKLSVTRVPLNRVPMVLQDGLFSRMYVSIQPEGATFDPPLPISFPNVDGAAPGETVKLMSFVHDLGRFAEVGSARVSADGRTVETEPGVGIREADWHATPRAPAALVTTVCGTTALPAGVDPNEIECDCWCDAQPAAPMGGGVVCAANVPVSAATLSEFRFDEGPAAAAQELQRRGGAASLECVCREKCTVEVTSAKPLSLQKGATASATASGEPQGGSISWTSGDPNVVIVQPSAGGQGAATLMANAIGTTTVTARHECLGGSVKEEAFEVQVTTADVVVIGWVDASPIDLIALAGMADPNLVGALNNPAICPFQLREWKKGVST
jgi:hypothetical protein